jgi:hypothetical protein
MSAGRPWIFRRDSGAPEYDKYKISLYNHTTASPFCLVDRRDGAAPIEYLAKSQNPGRHIKEGAGHGWLAPSLFFANRSLT